MLNFFLKNTKQESFDVYYLNKVNWNVCNSTLNWKITDPQMMWYYIERTLKSLPKNY